MRDTSERSTPRIAFAIGALALSVVACGYSGDGEFTSDGVWPLVNYELELPEVPLTGRRTFRIEGFRSHGRAFVSLDLKSPVPRAFVELALPVRMTITSDDGETVFEKSGPLNAHLARMRREGEITWPEPTEWMVQLAYEDEGIRSKAVPFSLETDPQPQSECVYWGLRPAEIGSGGYTLAIEVDDAAAAEDLRAAISIASGWK